MKVLKSTRNSHIEANKRRNLAVVVLLLVLSEFIIALGARITSWLLLAAVLPVLAVPIFLRRYDVWKAGSTGEKSVVRELQGLDDSYYLVSSVVLPGSRGDIDQVLLGANGVFVIETKNYSGKVVCDGDNWYRIKRGTRDAVRTESLSKQVKRNASQLRRFIHDTTQISLHVNPVLVFVHPAVHLELNNPTVPVLRPGELAGFIRGFESPFRLGEEQLELLGESIREASAR
ncbi:MAG: hypothetical protein DRI40_07265 [Chloroflexi bacterium]|nr:MAG: hypothetical protein DRI40_07265 [Chloroflexota bacterium]